MKGIAQGIGRNVARLVQRSRELMRQPMARLHGPWRALAIGLLAALALALLAVVGSALLMAVSWGNVALASQSSVCQSCHETRPAYEQWAQSTHKGIGCLNCHMTPDVKGYLSMNVRATVNLAKHFTGDYEAPIQARVDDSSCLKCHTKESRPETLPQASLRIAHSQHEEQQCADCHGRLVHKDAVDKDVVPPVTPILAKSHAQKDCQVCHPSPKPVYLHGQASLACTSCHSASIPKHDLAVSQGVMARESCQECHTRQRVVGAPEECQTCHVSPHGIDTSVKLQCTQCHTSPQSWTVVQVSHPLPLVGKHAEAACTTCHTATKTVKPTTASRTECSSCHQPPAKHFGTECAQCHKPGARFKMS